MSQESLPDGVVSLEDFRNRTLNSVASDEVSNSFGGYDKVDYRTWLVVNRMLTSLNGATLPDTFVVYQRTVKKPDVKVISSTGKNNWWGYLVDANSDDQEALTIDLEILEVDGGERLREPIERLYIASLIGQHVLRRDNRILDVQRTNTLTIGRETINCEPERGRVITEWRTAAGLGLIALSKDRSLRTNIREYLSETLENRLKHARSLGVYSDFFNTNIEDSAIDDWLVGVCKPFEQSEIVQVLHNTNLRGL